MTSIFLGIWIALNQQGQVMLEQGRAAEAVVDFRAAVTSVEGVLGADHPVTAMILRNLSLAYTAEGLYRKSEVAALRSLSIFERRFGRDDAVLVPSLNALGESLASQRRWTEARRVFERAVALGERGPHGATALHNLAVVHHVRKDSNTARQLYQQALDRRESLFGADHPVTAATRNALLKLTGPRLASARPARR